MYLLRQCSLSTITTLVQFQLLNFDPQLLLGKRVIIYSRGSRNTNLGLQTGSWESHNLLFVSLSYFTKNIINIYERDFGCEYFRNVTWSHIRGGERKIRLNKYSLFWHAAVEHKPPMSPSNLPQGLLDVPASWIIYISKYFWT